MAARECESLLTYDQLVGLFMRTVREAPRLPGVRTLFDAADFVHELRGLLYQVMALDYGINYVRVDTRLSHFSGVRKRHPLTMTTAAAPPQDLQRHHGGPHQIILALRVTSGDVGEHQCRLTAVLPRRAAHSSDGGNPRMACDMPRLPGPNRFRHIPMPVHDFYAGCSIACNRCGRRRARLRACTGCWFVRYCSDECWRANWPTHRPVCRAISSQQPM